MSLQLAKHETISLRIHPGFSETWLHDRICDDTSILGLGELDVIARELVQYSGGRLDLILADTKNDVRYEVEIMLGPTDPSHIIRCIEYWDIERRRYPAYDHVAVLVAEEVTSRFLNVISLLSGSIPLVAIQLAALKVGEQLVLNFVKVLDLRALREDETAEADGEEVDRDWWVARKGAESLLMCDRLLAIVNEKADPPFVLRYKKVNVGINTAGSFFNAITVYPRKDFIQFRAHTADPAKWVERFKADGIEADSRGAGHVRLWLGRGDLDKHEGLVRELLHEAVGEYES